MNKLFFISGLPRSGTAWASTLINLCPNAICLHEGEAIYRDGLVSKMQSRPELFSGDSAPNAKERRFDNVPATRVAIVRDFDEVITASRMAFHGLVSDDAIAADAERFGNWVATHNPLVISFKDLFTVAGAFAVWQHILGGQKFPVDKVAALTRTRVEQIIPSRSEILQLSDQLLQEA